MYTATFTFAKGRFDDEFHALDGVIAEIARGIPGYLGEEAWENPTSGLVSNVYYWETLEALAELMNHPAHLEAKQKQERWLRGYQVVVSEVVASYGDQRIAHPLARRAPLRLQGGHRLPQCQRDQKLPGADSQPLSASCDSTKPASSQ